jgi:signal transduction histidine kinase
VKSAFQTAIARLTFAYVMMLALVCILFSSFIYSLASNEIEQGSRRQVRGFRDGFGRFVIDEQASESLRSDVASEGKARLRARLFLANAAVIGGGAIACYFLAKKTLEPIEQNARAQERFAADASHELRTPLAVMRSEIEVALRDKHLRLGEAKMLLQSNLEEVVLMHGMTENLLQIARGSRDVEKKSVDVDRVLAAVIRKFRHHAKKSALTLTYSSSAGTVTTNKDVLTQLLTILVDNAVKYAGSGAAITVRARTESHQLIIDVSDNGIGIPAHHLSSIFDRFTRVDSSRSTQAKPGQGLGLSIAKQLVVSLGGTIVAESTPGKKTTFSVSLPL